jgi:hypothetical protein
VVYDLYQYDVSYAMKRLLYLLAPLTCIANAQTVPPYVIKPSAACTSVQVVQYVTANVAATCHTVAFTDISGTLGVSQGGTGQTSATDDTVLVGNGTGFDLKTVPGCTDTGGNHLNYTQSTNTFSCGTTDAHVGTVTSVDMTVPAELSVSGNPITTSGTLAVTKANESANTFWAGPTSGGAAPPAFRPIIAADISSAIQSLPSFDRFGGGIDGACTFDGTATYGYAALSGSVYTLTRAIYCTSITVSGSASVNTGSYPMFANGTVTCSTSATPCFLISCTSGCNTALYAGGNGANSGTAGGGSNPGSGGWYNINFAGTTGGAGNTGNGSGGTSGGGNAGTSYTTVANGAAGGGGGAGGTGLASSGGGAAVPSIIKTYDRDDPIFVTWSNSTGTGIQSGLGGSSGGGGGGDGTNHGGGGGGGGAGCGMGYFAFNIITKRSSGLLIACPANPGGNGGSPTAGNTGGGGGGGGGQGAGPVILVVGSVTGSGAITEDCSGGNGGTGGTHHGSAPAADGAGGDGGPSGHCAIYAYYNSSITTCGPAVGGSHTGTTGGTGASCQISAP